MMATPDTDLENTILGRKWFYQFRLPSGRVTESYLPAEMLPIHATRETMLLAALEQHLGTRWGELTCLDLACHEGFFSYKLAERGCRRVLGLDAREEHIRHATWIRDVYGLENLDFRRKDIHDPELATMGRFDIVLMFGLLYHLENPVGALRVAHALTKNICLIETQVAPHLSGPTDWGSAGNTKEIVGSFGIVDESYELSVGVPEASVSRISLFPSLQGLLWLLNAVGFRSCYVVSAPAGGYEQLVSGRRVVVAALQ